MEEIKKMVLEYLPTSVQNKVEDAYIEYAVNELLDRTHLNSTGIAHHAAKIITNQLQKKDTTNYD